MAQLLQRSKKLSICFVENGFNLTLASFLSLAAQVAAVLYIFDTVA